MLCRRDGTGTALKAGIFVRALIRRAEVEGASAFIVRKGNEEAGAIIIRVAKLDGTLLVLNQARMGDGASGLGPPAGQGGAGRESLRMV